MKTKINQTWKLASILGMSGFSGSATLASLAGLFTMANIPVIAVALIAGPGAIITATMVQGTIKERITVAILAGIMATGIIVLAASLGPRLFEFVNKDILKIAGGISVIFIALMIFGIKMPQTTPIFIMILGAIAALIWR